jgi:hypothetical protein
MSDSGMTPAPGGFVAQAKRLAVRVARRIFRRQVAINQSVCQRLDALEHVTRAEDPRWQALLDRVEAIERRQEFIEGQADRVLALGWDHAALVRRLCWLEDQLAARPPGHPALGRSDDASRAA